MWNFFQLCAVIGPLCEATLSLLRQEAVCQQTGDTDSDGDDDDIEHDELLIDAVTDVLPALGSCMGASFEPLFRQFYEPLMKFAVTYFDKITVDQIYLYIYHLLEFFLT